MSSTESRPWLSSYADGVPHEIETPEGSLFDIVAHSAATYPSAIALEFFGEETTYSELNDQILRVAEGLRLLGVQHGDRIALVLPNCPQHIVAFYAILRLGAIVVEHNPIYTPRELRHQFEDHGARIVIAWDKVVDTISQFPDDVPIDEIIAVDLTKAMPLRTRLALRLPVKKARDAREALSTTVHGVKRWEELVASAPLRSDAPSPVAEDIALIQYTSGTTGDPKGVILSHRNVVVNAAQARAWVPMVERGSSVVYAVLPMFHAYGLTLCLTFAMSMAARLVLFPKFEPEIVLAAMKKHPATFFPAVPPIYERLTRAADHAGVSLEGIAIGISGAMPLSTRIIEPWEAKTGGYLVEGYGLSETSPLLIANPVAPSRVVGAVGLPLPSTEVRIVDPDDPSQDRDIGEAGELIVRGPQVFRGYWNKPEETEKVFVPDGSSPAGDPWFRTGDIVTMDERGFIRIVDRIKELIISGGFNVSPSEVEDVLRGAPGVADIAVVGLPNAHSGEDVVAAIVAEPGTTIDSAAIRAFARDNLAGYKVPRRIVTVDELPRSLIGKVQRRILRDQLLAR